MPTDQFHYTKISYRSKPTFGCIEILRGIWKNYNDARQECYNRKSHLLNINPDDVNLSISDRISY